MTPTVLRRGPILPPALINDTADDVALARAARRWADPRQGRITVDPTPATITSAFLARDILAALGRTAYAPTHGPVITAQPAWRAAACWITIDDIRQLTVLRAHLLTAERAEQLSVLREVTGIRLILVASGATDGEMNPPHHAPRRSRAGRRTRAPRRNRRPALFHPARRTSANPLPLRPPGAATDTKILCRSPGALRFLPPGGPRPTSPVSTVQDCSPPELAGPTPRHVTGAARQPRRGALPVPPDRTQPHPRAHHRPRPRRPGRLRPIWSPPGRPR
ncbi:hypothetical protein SHL15_9277 [Streptomyces hygroscopicus subsp. limoneus]|nr:hypothetical protein SHL15_9277 [Streptomyces hygroscopicus subsp. limoneus]